MATPLREKKSPQFIGALLNFLRMRLEVIYNVWCHACFNRQSMFSFFKKMIHRYPECFKEKESLHRITPTRPQPCVMPGKAARPCRAPPAMDVEDSWVMVRATERILVLSHFQLCVCVCVHRGGGVAWMDGCAWQVGFSPASQSSKKGKKLI